MSYLTAPARLRAGAYDLLGREAVCTETDVQISFSSVPLDVRALAPGVYAYRMTSNGASISHGTFVVVR